MARPKASENIPPEVLTRAYDQVDLGEESKAVWEELLGSYDIAYRTWLQYVARHRQERKVQIVKDRLAICGQLAETIADGRTLSQEQKIALGSIVMAALSEGASAADNANLRRVVRDLAALRLARRTDRREAEAHKAEMERKKLLLESLQDTVRKGDDQQYDGEEGRERLKGLVREVYGLNI